jgi:hypothetical protein
MINLPEINKGTFNNGSTNNNSSMEFIQQDFVSKVTFDCLINKAQYAKYLEYKGSISKNNSKDKKFYRRRISDLTKQLLSNEKPDNLMPDVKFAFENYINSCISFFKVLDKTDILQEDYSGLEIDVKNEINIDNVGSTEEANHLMMRSIKISHPPTLDNFVTVKNIKPEVTPIIPIQKDINLKDPILKNKGIRKKKNIISNYDKTSSENL